MSAKTFDESYLSIVGEILTKGQEKHNRTGINTKSIFNRNVETPELGWDKLPISQIRKIYWKGAIFEAFWLMGIHLNDEKYRKLSFTNTQYLEDNNVMYWKPWTRKGGELGPVYGEQLCRWKKFQKNKMIMDESDVGYREVTINQIQTVIKTLREDRTSRRLVCSMWNPAYIEEMALPPCHYAFEFYVRDVEGESIPRLDIRWIQRSADMLVGIPYNVLIYSIVQKVVALCTGLVPGRVYGSLGDCHVYCNQIDQAKQLIRLYHGNEYDKLATETQGLTDVAVNPDMIRNATIYNKLPNLSDFNPDGSDFIVSNYRSMPKLEIPVAV